MRSQTPLVVTLAVVLAGTAACADPAGPGVTDHADLRPSLDVTFNWACPAAFERYAFGGDGSPSEIPPFEAVAADHNGSGIVCRMEIVHEATGEHATIWVDDHPDPVKIGKCHDKMEMIDAPADPITGEKDAVDENANGRKCKAKKAKKVDGKDIIEIVYADDNLEEVAKEP